ncbi:partial [Paramuricea clavata]|uniref:Partial n=1 Tax=Paramuricea clavata TaxID=317549 RepID=A0A6S7IK73_PARCT|nr:partial [Paramuricea clavata]
MVWNHVGTGCFKYDFYYLVAAKSREDCLQICQDDVRCALVAYRKNKHKCALCTEGYKHKASCGYRVELIAKDLNECAIGAHNCEENAVCVNTPGSFKCRCKTGYYKESGQHCIKVPVVEWISYKDRCLEVTSTFAVIEIPNVEQCKLKCQITVHCAMVEYQPNNNKCKMAKHRKFKPVPSCNSRTDLFVKAVIECDNEGKECPKHAYCHAKEGNRLCRCRFGYTGNGKICHDVDECSKYSNLCGQHAKCHNTIGNYKCVCLPGYHGDGQFCRKDKLKKEDIELFEKNHKQNTFHTIINLFNNSGSHCFAASSQVFTLLAILIASFIVNQFQ